MRRLVLTLALGLMATACGSDAKGPDTAGGDSGEDTDPGDGPGATVVYPDSLCTETACAQGGCDGDASDPATPDCSAWQINGTFALQAVRIDEDGARGVPPPPAAKSDSDVCPGNTVTPEGV